MTLHKSIAATVLAFVALTLAACGGGSGATAEGDIGMGPTDAKVTVVEYASPTCPHCAAWQADTWPAFKAKYVDTNKVRYVFREMPTPPVDVASAGFLLARCAGPDKYLDVIHQIMASQKEWQAGVSPRSSLIRIAGGVGLNEEQFTACVTDEKALAALEKRIQAAVADGVNGTPTFKVNGVTVAYTGSAGATIDDLSPVIDAALAK